MILKVQFDLPQILNWKENQIASPICKIVKPQIYRNFS